MQDIHLSVVASSRNDEHGGNLLYRTQHFVSGFISQCNRHQLRAELILVEWNPPPGKPPLKEVLNLPENTGFSKVRIIQVPQEVHQLFSHHDKLPFFQMLAKNVGIRRAQGKFILSTNIDVLFSDEVIQYLRDNLKKRTIYRADRFDVPSQLISSEKFEEILSFCKQASFRIHRKHSSFIKINGKWKSIDTIKNRKVIELFMESLKDFHKKLKNTTRQSNQILKYLNSIQTFQVRPKNPVKILLKFYRLNACVIQFLKYYLLEFCRLVRSRFSNRFFKKSKWRYISKPHTNACGDFTLMSREDWARVKGYPEWPYFSWHIDSLLIYQALFHDIKLKNFSKKRPFYHIEHGQGSGYTPEYANLLFERLHKHNIPYITYPQFLDMVKTMQDNKKKGELPIYNDANWGLFHYELKEMLP